MAGCCSWSGIWIFCACLFSFHFELDASSADLSVNAKDQYDLPDEEFTLKLDFQAENEPLFVSLGSYCWPALTIKNCGLRRASFPLDWVVSLNGEKVIELLDNRFVDFTNEAYFVSSSRQMLLHSYYELAFQHEGLWENTNDFKKVQEFQEKYERRIERFKRLNEYKGKIYFIRAALNGSTHPVYPFPSQENIQISEEYALRLFESLKRIFPDLDFYLVIKNHKDKEDFEYIKVTDRIVIIKTEIEEVRNFPSLF